MAIEVEVQGNGRFAGHRSNLISYSSVEDSTPLDPADTSGQTGTLSFGAVEDPGPSGSILLLNDTVILTDTGSGTTRGVVNMVNVSDGVSNITADSRLGILNVTGYIPPFTGILVDAVWTILSQAGIDSGIVVSADIANIPVTVRGGTYNYWLLLKELASGTGMVEHSLVSGNFVTRGIREREAFTGKIAEQSWSVGNVELAQYVEVAYYNYRELVGELVYPYGGWNEDVQVLQADSGQTITTNIPVDVSLTALSQPVVQDFVPRDYIGPPSVYSVTGNDGLPILASQWTASGGKLSVAIGADGQSIDVTITGARIPSLAPFQIAVASGPSDLYSTLRIVGSGLGFERKILRVPTGAPAEKTAQEVGATVDNPWVNTINDAYSAALRAAGGLAAPRQTVTITATVINRSGSSGSYAYPTFADFSDQYPTETFADFDAEWAGQTFEDFNQYEFSLVQNDFENQVFGNVSGSRLLFRNAYYRIRNATVTQDGIITATAERDTIFSDFNDTYSGMTFQDFNDLMESVTPGMKFEDYAVVPLINQPTDTPPIGYGFGFGPFGEGPFGG